MANDGTVKIGTELDKKGLKDGLSGIGSFAAKGFGVLKTGAGVAAKAVTAAVGVASTAVGALGTMAMKSYAEYEQLTGGIETLFGAGGQSLAEYANSVGKMTTEVRSEYEQLMTAQSAVMKNAQDAYKTAGLSANDYMATVTSFAASLKQSTESEAEAADAANQAVIDMADNANKMGTSMELIQNAYQGFAKQNYTMLDNLKLGYGGTKEEMQRLLEDAEKLTGAKYDISNLNDVYSAIHAVQTELGITGTTAKEASTTIEGSMNAMKASWSNLITGIADDSQNFDELVDNFVSSAIVAGENILPRVEVVLDGIGQLIESMLPIIVARIPEIVNSVLPGLVASGANMVVSLVEGLEQNLPQILQCGGEILITLAQGIGSLIPSLASTAYKLITYLLSSITKNSGSVVKSGAETLIKFIEGCTSKIPELLSMAVDAIVSMAMALTEPNTLINIINAGIELLTSLVQGLTDAIPKLLASVPIIVANFVAALIASIPRLLVAAREIMLNLGKFLLQHVTNMLMVVPRISERLREAFAEMDWKQIGKNIIDGITNGIVNAAKGLAQAAANAAKAALDAAKNFLGIHSPSRVMRDVIGKNMIAGINVGMEDETPELEKQSRSSAQTAVNAMKKASAEEFVIEMKQKAFLVRNDAAEKDSSIQRDNRHESSEYPPEVIDYERMADANAKAMEGMAVKVDERDFGRIVRDVK